MSIEENKAVIIRFVEQFNKGNLGVIDECFSDNFVRYATDGKVMDREGYRQFSTRILNMVPDIQITLGDIVAEGDKVAFYFTLSGAYKGDSDGDPSMGKPFRMSEAYFSRFEDGKIVEFRNFQTQRENKED